MNARRALLVLLLTLFVASIAPAQTTDKPPHHPGVPATAETPRFKFAILTDRHGGRKMDSTVFVEAIDEINLLDPDFTISVGDLINGYTDKPDEITKQWDELDRDVRRLKRPFYYVFGNHDATNPVMVGILQKRYGRPYYSFDHKGCHFIVLFTWPLDAEGKAIGIDRDAAQVEWLKKDLAASKDAVHTFVFFHHPWPSGEIAKLFAGRPTTIFAGHWHTYQQFVKDGINYHVLSVTGGGIRPDFYDGAFYHYGVVSVSGKNVSTAIVRVGAVLPDDLLSVDRLGKIRETRASLARLYCEVPRGAKTLDQPLALVLPNPLPSHAKGEITWAVPEDSAWDVTPRTAEFVLDPGKETPVPGRVTCSVEPLATDQSTWPRYQLKVMGGRALNTHSPRVAGLDPLYDVAGTLCPDAWPYAAKVDAFRRSVMGPVHTLKVWGDKIDRFTVTNPFDDLIHVDFAWDIRNDAWKIAPGKLVLDLPPGVKVPVAFVMPRVIADVYPLPRLHVKATLKGETVFDEVRPLAVDAEGCFTWRAPTAGIKRLAAAPTFDGKTDDAAWTGATTLTDFIRDDGRAEPERQTVVRVGTTGDGLWLAFRCDEPSRARVRARAIRRDGIVWEDDSCEIFLDTNLDRKTYTQLIFNTLGTQYDGSGKDASWNADWQVKTAWDKGSWTAEVFVPWTSLGTPPVRGTQWGLNFARNRCTTRPTETSMWSPTLGTAHSPGRFGVVVFE